MSTKTDVDPNDWSQFEMAFALRRLAIEIHKHKAQARGRTITLIEKTRWKITDLERLAHGWRARLELEDGDYTMTMVVADATVNSSEWN